LLQNERQLCEFSAPEKLLFPLVSALQNKGQRDSSAESELGETERMTPQPVTFPRHRFPAEIASTSRG